MRLQKTTHTPKQINCLHVNQYTKKEEVIATVYCEGTIRTNAVEISVAQLSELKTISENFKLFYDNLTTSLHSNEKTNP